MGGNPVAPLVTQPVAGVKPHSGNHVLAFSSALFSSAWAQSSVAPETSGAITIEEVFGKPKIFEIKEFWFACYVSNPTSIVAVPQACTVDVFGWERWGPREDYVKKRQESKAEKKQREKEEKAAKKQKEKEEKAEKKQREWEKKHKEWERKEKLRQEFAHEKAYKESIKGRLEQEKKWREQEEKAADKAYKEREKQEKKERKQREKEEKAEKKQREKEEKEEKKQREKQAKEEKKQREKEEKEAKKQQGKRDNRTESDEKVQQLANGRPTLNATRHVSNEKTTSHVEATKEIFGQHAEWNGRAPNIMQSFNYFPGSLVKGDMVQAKLLTEGWKELERVEIRRRIVGPLDQATEGVLIDDVVLSITPPPFPVPFHGVGGFGPER